MHHNVMALWIVEISAEVGEFVSETKEEVGIYEYSEDVLADKKLELDMVVRLDDIVVDTNSRYDLVTEVKEAREKKKWCVWCGGGGSD